MSFLRFVLAASIPWLSPLAAHAQCPAWDPSFHQAGFNDSVKRTAVFDDGPGPAIYAVGRFTQVSGAAVQSIARFDGTHWHALPGQSVPSASLDSIHVWDDGTGPALYVGGAPNPQGGIASIYKWDGSTWTALPGSPDSEVWVLDDFGGSLYVGGVFEHVAGQPQRGIARWNGSNWVSMPGMVGGPQYYSGVFAFQVFDDGSGPALFAGGGFDSAGGISSASIGKWDGTTWSAVAPISFDYVSSLTVFDAGSGPDLVAAGPGSQYAGVKRLHQGTWLPTGGALLGSVNDVAVYDDGFGIGPQLYAAGNFSSTTSVNYYNVARWTGTTWTGLDLPPTQTVWDLLAEDPFGGNHLFAFGDFDYAGNSVVRHAAQWNGTAWAPMEPNTGVVGYNVQAMTSFDDIHGNALYVGGAFTMAGNTYAGGVARWDGTTWSPLQGGTDGGVSSLCVFDDGAGPKLYVGGNYFHIGTTYTRFGRWDGTQWSTLPGGFPFDVSFDPSSGQYLPFYSEAMVVFDDGSGPALYMGGVLALNGTSGIARYKNGAWETLGSGLSSEVRALAVHDNGTGPALYAGGLIYSSGTLTLSNIAKWNGTQWLDVGVGLQSISSHDGVYALASFDDGTGPALYAGGSFTNPGGVPGASYVARFRNGAWEAFGSGPSGAVESLTVYDDGTGAGSALYAGGYFTSAGGQAAKSLAKWNGSSWTPVDLGVTNMQGGARVMLSLAVWHHGMSRDLYVGGGVFLSVAHTSATFARWIGCGETGRLYCFGDGSGAQCPCGNDSNPGEQAGCLHSFGAGATLRAVGEPSLSEDSLVLHGADMPSSAVLYFQGVGSVAGGAGVAFGDGLRCVSGPFVRIGTKVNVNGVSSFPSGLDVPVSIGGGIHSPGLRTYQTRYRNSASFCTSDTFNTTNGLEILWTP